MTSTTHIKIQNSKVNVLFVTSEDLCYLFINNVNVI